MDLHERLRRLRRRARGLAKGWAYNAAGAWTNAEVIGGRILASFTQGMAADAGFRTAVDMLDRLDPHRIFSTPFLDRLMPRSRDLTGDGQVKGSDMAELLGRWTGGKGLSWRKGLGIPCADANRTAVTASSSGPTMKTAQRPRIQH